MPDRLYQQNHCGIYRMERQKAVWERIGMKMPKKVGDIGFLMVLHPRDPIHAGSNGWYQCVAAHKRGRQAGSVQDGKRGEELDEARQGNASGQRMVDRFPAGDDS